MLPPLCCEGRPSDHAAQSGRVPVRGCQAAWWRLRRSCCAARRAVGVQLGTGMAGGRIWRNPLTMSQLVGVPSGAAACTISLHSVLIRQTVAPHE